MFKKIGWCVQKTNNWVWNLHFYKKWLRNPNAVQIKTNIESNALK